MYKIFNVPNGNIFIVTNNDKTFIPMDEANTDYKEYLEWVAKGNTAEEYIPEEV